MEVSWSTLLVESFRMARTGVFDDAREIIATERSSYRKDQSTCMELLFYIMYPSTLLYPGIFDRYRVEICKHIMFDV